jgi:hypothetical protein
MGWYPQQQTEVLGEKTVAALPCPQQIPHVATRDWTRDSTVLIDKTYFAQGEEMFDFLKGCST